MKVGIIYGDVGSTNFNFAVTGKVKRLDYVRVPHEEGEVLAQVTNIQRLSNLSFDEVVSEDERKKFGNFEEFERKAESKLSAFAEVIGYKGKEGIQFPRTPFNVGGKVYAAPEELVKEVVGLGESGLYIGLLKNRKLPVYLDPKSLQKHLSILAKTGSGKSYAMGVVIEELLKKRMPIVVIDPHGEYVSLSYPSKRIDEMEKFGIEPRGYKNQIVQYSLDVEANPGSEQIFLDGKKFEARELIELMPSKLSGSQIGILYEAIKKAREWNDRYTISDIKDEVIDSESAAKWNLIPLLEWLEDIKIFSNEPTPMDEIAKRGKCSIMNLRGSPPDVQEVFVSRLAMELFESRKNGKIPPLFLVVEEAHRYCPERGKAVSSKAMRTIASEGRKFGLGLAVVSQRPARIDKNVLSQCGTEIILKVTNPNDLKAITQSVGGLTNESADEIQRLPIGNALVMTPSINFPIFVEIRNRETEHGLAIRGKGEKAKIKIKEIKRRESKKELIHRVANRIGYVTTTNAEETMKILREAALKMGDNSSKYLNAIAKLGIDFCLEKPKCSNCPMKDRCAYYKKRKK